MIYVYLCEESGARTPFVARFCSFPFMKKIKVIFHLQQQKISAFNGGMNDLHMSTCVRNLEQGPLLWRDFVIAQHNLKLSWE